MVGSGFSKNATPVRPDARELPMWNEVIDSLHADLYSNPDTAPKPDTLKTPQEFDASLGRPALHEALIRLVRDQDHNPGESHRRLLRLPWDSIYSTNWDTLLERTSEQISDRHYGIVSDVKQIPIADRPRIVKLHGSFPITSRLIVTEEDYRTYQKEFAPFVNMVQQSMMETTFFLIGFSGDDPNFLNWSGWVRDNLGESAPKIYLAGWLNLSEHRRRMLEQRNVVPIDLARHPQEHSWPDDLKHHYATQWILETFEKGKPYDVANWPIPPGPPVEQADEPWQPVEPVRSRTPKAEPRVAQVEGETSVETLRQAIKVWRRNRATYPGWLILPTSQYWELQGIVEEWHPIITTSLEKFEPTERLSAIRELFWRYETFLQPIGSELESLAKETLELIDCQNRTVNNEACKGNWRDIRQNWRTVAASFVTAARYQSDRQNFEKWVAALTPYEKEDPEVCNRLFHERCLWAINEMDFDTLDLVLKDWDPTDSDPAWKMRKSALLREALDETQAEHLLNQAINEIENMQTEEDSLTIPSRKSWAIFTTLHFNNRRSVFNRLLQLAPFRCDPLAEQRIILESIQGQYKGEEPPSFDVNTGRALRVLFLPRVQSTRFYRPQRMGEIAGVPPFANGDGYTSPVWAEVLTKTAEGLAESDLPRAIRLLLRAHSSTRSRALGNIMSRPRIATLPTEQADDLARAAMRTISRLLSAPNQFDYQARIGDGLEILSRLVVRTSSDTTLLIFDKALELCRNLQMIQGTNWNQLRDLMERSWECLPMHTRKLKALTILNTPLLGLDLTAHPIATQWPDPGQLLADFTTAIDRSPDDEDQWQSCIVKITRGLQGNTPARQPASYRTVALLACSTLSKNEKQPIAQALWSDTTLGTDGLPSGTGLHDFAFLNLPEPTKGLAQKRFFQKWLPSPDHITKANFEQVPNPLTLTGDYGFGNDRDNLENCLWQLSSAFRNLRHSEIEPELSDEQKVTLANLVETWAEAVPPPHDALQDPFRGHVLRQRAEDVARRIPTLISEIEPTATFSENLYRKVENLHQRQISALELVADVARLNPARKNELAILIRDGLTSDDRTMASSAAYGLRRWLESTSQPATQAEPPPDHLINQIGFTIASRRTTVTVWSLMAAEFIFEHGTEEHKEAIRHHVADGLSYLLEELSYDRQRDDPNEIPELRLACARLAMKMSLDQQEPHPSVIDWIEAARQDPLPEVRFAVQDLDNDQML